MNRKDTQISARLQTIARKVRALVEKECGEPMGIALFLQPYHEGEAPPDGQPTDVREFQYVSSFPRAHMLGMMKATVEKWEAGQPDIPPHLRN